MTKLTKENIETQIMLYVDNELPAGAVQDLIAYLEKYPEYKALLSDYQYSVLSSEEMVFAHKEQLLKPQSRKVVSLKTTIGIAAAVAIILTITGYYQWTRNDSILPSSRMALNKTDKSAARIPQVIIADPDKRNKKQDVVQNAQKVKGTGGVQSVASVHVRPDVRRKNDLGAMEPMNDVLTVALTHEHRPVPVFVKPVNTSFRQQEQGAVPEQVTAHPPKNGLVAAQITTIYEQSDRLAGIHSLVAELDERKNRAVDAWQQIKTANVVLKIGSKEIVIK